MNSLFQKLVIVAMCAGASYLLFWFFPNHLQAQVVIPFALLAGFLNTQNRDFRLYKPAQDKPIQGVMFFSSVMALFAYFAALAYYGYVNGFWPVVILFCAATFIGALMMQALSAILGSYRTIAFIGFVAWPLSACAVYLLLMQPQSYLAYIAQAKQILGL